MRTAHSASREGTLTHTIIEAVADTTNVSPLELSTPLNEVIDADALERIFSEESTVREVVFHYHDCEVRVFSDGHVSVEQEAHR